MGIQKKAFRRLALAIAVPGMAAGALAGFAAAPAMASTAQPAAHYPVYERISGFSNDATSAMNVQVTGGFFDSGSVNLNLISGLAATVSLSQGTQNVTLTPTSITTNIASNSCAGTISVTAALNVNGGTGAYAGLVGTGTATLTGNITVPRVFNGGCNLNVSNLMSLGVHLNLVATAELTAAT
jgi:hypothetical protein